MRCVEMCIVGLLGWLGGCGEPTESEDCTSTRGTVSGMIFTDWECTSTADDARLEFRVEGDETPLLVRPSEDGSYTVDLEAGNWLVTGYGYADTCTTEEPIPFTVEACAPITVDVCAKLCVDG